MSKRIPLIAIICLFLSSLFFSSCDKIWKGNRSTLDSTAIREMISGQLIRRPYKSAWDSAIVEYYQNGGDLLWLSPAGKVRERILLSWMKQLKRHGFNPNRIGLERILQTEEKYLSSRTGDKDIHNIDAACLEYVLTRSYLRYVCGMNYGFVDPRPLYNNLYEDLTAYPDTLPPPADRVKKMFRLYTIPLEYPTKKYALDALQLMEKDINRAYRSVQPSTLYYKKLQAELQRVKSDKFKARCVKANLERARWKYKQKMGSKYVFVNTAAFMLKAVDMKKDTLFEMKICCGSFNHKTPLMTSNLSYFELNPNWIVPPKIIRKEIIPKFVTDSAYFDRNRLRVYDKNGKQLNPRRINWSKYANSGVPFKVMQDSGDGSDLGRIIFRFPNRFSVYLHDTSSKGTFSKEYRSVSHGCIRLERPLDLAYFLMSYPTDEKMDNIRIAVGVEPITEKGKELMKDNKIKNRKFYGFNNVPLFIDYRTLYMDKNGSLIYCNDHYGYDIPLVNALTHLKY
jgi:murein L,D-transpeptidase YcbB/YkuD